MSASTEEWPAGPPCSHCGGPTLAPRPGSDEEGFYCEACGTAWSTTKWPLRRLSYVRIGESVDTETGEVSRTYDFGKDGSYTRVRGYVTERWMRNHGWLH